MGGDDVVAKGESRWRIGAACLLAGVLLAGCGGKPSPASVAKNSANTSEERAGGNMDIAYRSRLETVGSYGTPTEICRVFASRGALEDFVGEHVGADGLFGEVIWDAVRPYDEEFFKTSALIFVLFDDGGGAGELAVAGVEEQGGQLVVRVEKRIQEEMMGAAVMSRWVALVEVDTDLGGQDAVLERADVYV